MSVLRYIEKTCVALMMVLYLINAKGGTSCPFAVREELIIVKRGKCSMDIISLSKIV